MAMRFGASFLFAAAVTFGLFFLMQILVATGNTQLSDYDSINLADMISVEEEQTVQRKKREAKKLEEPDTPPPDVNTPKTTVDLNPNAININVAAANADINLGQDFGSVQDGEYLPLVRVEPQYPRRAQERGIEGEAIVEFTVTQLGTTEACTVIFEEPKGYFGRAACRAVEKWKYRPKVVNGEALPVIGVQTLLTFKLADE